MKPWIVLGQARTPDGTELTLTCHDNEYVITAGHQTLMSSRAHGSEDALGALGCRRARTLPRPRVLIGGLGMGFTLRAALDVLPAEALVVVVELVPAVVEWNRGPLGAAAHYPLKDHRVRVEECDVAVTIGSGTAAFDAILLDVDNGPAAMATASNAGLYSQGGLVRFGPHSSRGASLRYGLRVTRAGSRERYAPLDSRSGASTYVRGRINVARNTRSSSLLAIGAGE